MKKKVYIHIGSHKTGTTSIQKTLVANQTILEEYGLTYFSDKLDGMGSQSSQIGSWFKKFPKTKIKAMSTLKVGKSFAS